jgi:hypothetical protein
MNTLAGLNVRHKRSMLPINPHYWGGKIQIYHGGASARAALYTLWISPTRMCEKSQYFIRQPSVRVCRRATPQHLFTFSLSNYDL